MAVTIADARNYLGIDVSDDAMINANVTRALATAEMTMLGAVGDDVRTYLPDDPRTDELVLLYLDDLYSNRGISSAKANNATRRLISDMELQLRCELRRAKEAAD